MRRLSYQVVTENICGAVPSASTLAESRFLMSLLDSSKVDSLGMTHTQLRTRSSDMQLKFVTLPVSIVTSLCYYSTHSQQL